MSEPYESDIEASIESPVGQEDNPQTIAYQIAAQIMEDCKPGFVLVGSPIMGETESGFLYPDAVGLVINHAVGLTESSMASILREIANQLDNAINTVEDYLKEEAEGGEDDKQ